MSGTLIFESDMRLEEFLFIKNTLISQNFVPAKQVRKFIIFSLISSQNTGNRFLVGCFGFNGPLRQYFSLYRAVSQREGERGEKG